MNIALWVVFGIAVIAIFVINSLIMKRNMVANAFAGIDAQLKKRCDLIPNLVAAVRKYMEHESGVFQEVTELRSRAMQRNIAPEEAIALDGRISGALRGIMVQAENYPELKASGNMEQLQRSLNEVEEQLAAARRFYNSAATEFNNAIMMFPGVLFAGMLKMHRAELFSITPEERANVDVGKLFNS